MKRVWQLIRSASVLYVATMVAGVIASLWLPRRNATDFETACYWTDAMLVFVQCGDGAWLGWLREPIYNLYYSLFYVLFGQAHIRNGNSAGWLYLIAGLAVWAAVVVTCITLWRTVARRFTSGR